MKVIFLDVDGVLNCTFSKSNCGSCRGIDDDKVKLLKAIVKTADAKIFLVSDWKDGWYKEPFLKNEQDIFASYLDKKLKRQGLYISDKIGGGPDERGKAIKEFLQGKRVKSFVILDDNDFDYEAENLGKNFVKTDKDVGLNETSVLKACDILCGEFENS